MSAVAKSTELVIRGGRPASPIEKMILEKMAVAAVEEGKGKEKGEEVGNREPGSAAHSTRREKELVDRKKRGQRRTLRSKKAKKAKKKAERQEEMARIVVGDILTEPADESAGLAKRC